MRRDRIAEKKAIMVAELDCLLADAKALRGEASSVPTPEFEKALINYLVARARQADELRRLDRYLSPVGKTFEQEGRASNDLRQRSADRGSCVPGPDLRTVGM